MKVRMGEIDNLITDLRAQHDLVIEEARAEYNRQRAKLEVVFPKAHENHQAAGFSATEARYFAMEKRIEAVEEKNIRQELELQELAHQDASNRTRSPRLGGLP